MDKSRRDILLYISYKILGEGSKQPLVDKTVAKYICNLGEHCKSKDIMDLLCIKIKKEMKEVTLSVMSIFIVTAKILLRWLIFSKLCNF